MTKKSKSRARRLWTEKDLEYLSDHYGVLPDELLAQRLNRTKVAIKVIVGRRLTGLRRAGAFYTAKMLASTLGYSDSKSITRWVRSGWLKATKGPPGAGPSKMWNITEDAIVELLHRRPWLADIKRMEEHYFRSIVKEEFTRDPWYSPKQVTPRLGLKHKGAVLGYIHRGWLRAEKQPGGPEHRGWVIRESAIREFLRNDPRQRHQSDVCRAARVGANLRLGIPMRLSIVWQVQCSTCGNQVQVTAPAFMRGHEVKQAFTASVTPGHCNHGSICSIQNEPALCQQEVKCV